MSLFIDRPKILLATLLLTLLMAVLPGVAFAVNPNSATTSGGSPLDIRIDTPVDGSSGAAGDQIDVTGNVGVGGAGGTGALVIDLS